MNMTRARASALLFGAAAAGATAVPLRAQTGPAVRVASQPTEPGMQPFFAKELGFFAAAGLNVDVQTMSAPSAVVAAVTSGAIDIGYSTVDVLAAIHQRNVPLLVIAPGSDYVTPGSERTSAIVVLANSPIRQAKDLNGKIFATSSLHSLGQTIASKWVDDNGGTSSTMKFVEVPFPAIPAAIESGRVDAAFIVEPLMAAALKNGRVLAYGLAIAKQFLIGVFFTTPQWAAEHRDVVRKFAGVMHDTAEWANKNPAQSAVILAKYTKLDPAVIATMARNHYAETLTPALLQPLIDVSAKYNDYSTFPAQLLLLGTAH